MSVREIIGADGLILPSLYVSGGPGPTPTLAAVLAVGNNGGALGITNAGNIGAADIQAPFGSITAFNSTTIQDVGGTGLGILPSGNLTLKGAQTKGSILVGNGTTTAELAVPTGPPLPDGSVLILDSTAPLGIKWGGESGDINSITPGNNIDITGASANPIVAFQSPTTSDILLGVGTKIQAKDNYATPNFTMSIDADGLSDTYLSGGVENKEDISVSSTGVIQTISATDGSTYTNTDILSVSNTGITEVFTAGNVSTQYSSINNQIQGTSTISTTTSIDVGGTYNNTITEGTTTTTSYATYSAIDTNNANFGQVNITSNHSTSSAQVSVSSAGVPVPPFPAPTAGVSMSCTTPANPNILLTQSAPFAPSYSTTIDKDGITQIITDGGNTITRSEIVSVGGSTQQQIFNAPPNTTTINMASNAAQAIGSLTYAVSGGLTNFSQFEADAVRSRIRGYHEPVSGGPQTITSIETSPAGCTLRQTQGAIVSEINTTSASGLIISTAANSSISMNNGGQINLTSGPVGGQVFSTQYAGSASVPHYVFENTNISTASYPAIKIDRTSATSVNGDTIGSVSFWADNYAGATKEYVRMSAVSQQVGSGGVPTNIDGTFVFQTLVNDTFNTFMTLNGSSQQVEVGKEIDLNNNAITTASGNIVLNATTSSGNGDINLKCKNGTGNLVLGGDQIQSATAGAASGQFLVIALNGTTYKIALLNP